MAVFSKLQFLYAGNRIAGHITFRNFFDFFFTNFEAKLSFQEKKEEKCKKVILVDENMKKSNKKILHMFCFEEIFYII